MDVAKRNVVIFDFALVFSCRKHLSHSFFLNSNIVQKGIGVLAWTVFRQGLYRFGFHFFRFSVYLNGYHGICYRRGLGIIHSLNDF